MRKFLAPDKYQQSESDKRVQQELRAAGKLPRHIAVIMDGNGRWAENAACHAPPVIRPALQACGT